MTRAHLVLCLALLTALGSAPSASALEAPAHDDFANAQDLGTGDTVSVSGTNLWATAEADEPVSRFGPAQASVWYRWTAPRSDVVRAQTCRSSFDTKLAVFRGSSLEALSLVAVNDNRCSDRSATRFLAIAGTTYHVAVDGVFRAMGNVELKLRYLIPPPNDNFANARDLGSGLTALASGTNRDATVEPREPDHADGRTIASVWYRWTAPANRTIQVETCGSDFDTVVAVYADGPGFDGLRSISSDDNGCRGSAGSLVRFRAVGGSAYHIAVAGYRRARGSIGLNLTTQTQPARTR
jgi:hypothetical protein